MPGEEITFLFNIPERFVYVYDEIEVKVDLESGYSSVFTKQLEFANAKYADKKPVIDGVVSPMEWRGTWFGVNELKYVVNIKDWSGINDFSFEANTMWDEENLYFLGIVTDDIHFTQLGTQDPSRIWNADSIQLGIDDTPFKAALDYSTFDRGYKVTTTLQDLADIQPGEKIWGNHNPSGSQIDILLDEGQPTLAQMTDAAIRALDGSDEGFFLMIEGSKVDEGGHNNNIVTAVSEYIAFDEAFKIALDFAQSRTDTVVMVAPDHDTGGLDLPNADSVGGNTNSSDYADAVAEVQVGINSKNNISWQTGSHTNRRCGIWMYAPAGINPPDGLSDTPGDNPTNRGRIIDNTEIAPYLAELMGLDLQEATDQLFVDVTELGSYDENSSTFTFNDVDISIKANQSVATVKGNIVDLDGQVAVYSNGRFYVPKSLLPRKIGVKDTRYKDDLTARMLVKGQIAREYAGKQVSLILCKKGVSVPKKQDIGYVAQSKINDDGSYIFKFNFNGDIDQYEVRMFLGNELVTDSITQITAGYSWLDADVLLVQKVNSISSEVTINNYYGLEGLSYSMALCFYDNNKKLIKIIKSDYEKTVDGKLTVDYLIDSIPEGAEEVKAFVWSNITQMIPLCDSGTATLQ